MNEVQGSVSAQDPFDVTKPPFVTIETVSDPSQATQLFPGQVKNSYNALYISHRSQSM